MYAPVAVDPTFGTMARSLAARVLLVHGLTLSSLGVIVRKIEQRVMRARITTARTRWSRMSRAAASALCAGSLLSACISAPSLSGDVGGAGGTGAVSGSSGGSSGNAAARCGQACQDDEVAFAVDNAGWLLYNQDVAGQPSGNITRSVACPLSGQVDITGSVSTSNNGITTAELTFAMTGCGVAAADYTLTYTGTLTMNGTFTANVQNDITFKSSNLTIGGQLKVLDDPSIDETCDVSVTDTWDYNPADSAGLNGAVCGRATESGSGNASSGGSGGTGSNTGGSAGSTSSSGVSTSVSGVTTCGNCPGQLECSTITGKCVVQSCACFYTIDGSDADSSWYLANDGCFMCQQNGLVTGDCTAAADAAARAVVNCQ